MKRSTILLSWIIVLLGTSPLSRAVEQPAKPSDSEKPEIEVVQMTIHPARPPRAALKYRLLPTYLDMTYGDAAPLYSKACLLRGPSDKTSDEVVKWINTPVDQLPREEVRKALSNFEHVFAQLELAAGRTDCDWGLPIREADNPYEIFLPELQEARELARLLCLKGRLEIAEGRFDEAIHSLQTGFAMARHVADQETLVGRLVGIAVASMMLDQVEALIQLVDAPNLYWAFTALPTPLIDMREAIEMESAAIYLMFPQLADVKTRKYTPAQWEALFDEEGFLSRFESLLELDPKHTAARKKDLKETLERAYPVAKRELVARGYAQKEVDEMPPSQVVVLHASLTFDEIRDGLFKWFYVPYWQAREGVEAARKEVEASAGKEAIPLASLLLPAVANCQVAMTKLERRIAALRSVEAIRLHAAEHGGKLPESLGDVTEVPIPFNPFTGEPFAYRLEGDTAVLEAAGPEKSQPRQYRLRLAK